MTTINHPLFPYPMTRMLFIVNCIGLFSIWSVFKIFDLSVTQNLITLVVGILAACYLINAVYYRLTYLKLNRAYTLSLFIPVINFFLLMYLIVRGEPSR